MLPIIHAPTTRAMIDTFYNTLSEGEDPSAAQAALILSIAATSAFFFNENSKAFSTFASSEDATQTALAWFRSALNILDQSQQITMLGLMGGPTDGTYSVQPRQMNVKYPRNINDDANSLADESIDHPSDTATEHPAPLMQRLQTTIKSPNLIVSLQMPSQSSQSSYVPTDRSRRVHLRIFTCREMLFFLVFTLDVPDCTGLSCFTMLKTQLTSAHETSA
ncbi:putative transcription factor lepB [Colletotrichum sp. SAR 10_66]|nr:putative transcription factor lepB [Colletotrichum sp. SAR 10_66]